MKFRSLIWERSAILVLKAEQHDNFKASFFLESVEETARYILPSFCSWICYVFGLLRACLRFCKPKLKQSYLTSHTKTGVKHHEKKNAKERLIAEIGFSFVLFFRFQLYKRPVLIAQTTYHDFFYLFVERHKREA